MEARQETTKMDSAIEDSMLSLSSYNKFRTFDERTMTGKGVPDTSLFVYVKENDSLILVRVSNNVDSLIFYKKWGRYWINRHWENTEYKDSFVCKHGMEKYATLYDRMIFNDTILELRRVWINDDFLDALIIRDTAKVKVLNLFDDIKDYGFPYPDMLRILRYYNKHKSLTFCNSKYNFIRDDITEYHIIKEKDSIIFNNGKKTLKYEKNPICNYYVFPDF